MKDENDTKLETISSLSQGAEIIRAHLKNAPATSGVYRMLDKEGKALYIGKAKNIKARVSSYANIGALNQRLCQMVMQIASLEFVTTNTEAEALLLEANMIKRLTPRYNILLRDDKSFPYILISKEHPYPRIVKHRGAQKENGEYFGPFASVHALNETLTLLQKVFLLRPCADSVFSNRKRPCLQYQIKRCSAPCVGKVSEESYRALVDQATAFLKGKSREIPKALLAEMEAASAVMEFEKAAALRDRIRALTRVQQEQRLQMSAVGDADVVGVSRLGEKSCVQVFFFRNGQNYGNKSFFLSHTQESSEAEILAAFLGQFYEINPPPKHILVSHTPPNLDVMKDALALRAGHKVEVLEPQRGDKHDAMQVVLRNAREALQRHLVEHTGQNALLEGTAKLFAMGHKPERIEIYDNSHLMGREALGGMVVAGPEGFIKNAYRKFNIKKTDVVVPTGGDDFAMMREVLTRRFTRLQKDAEEGAKQEQWPDLILIDGGAAHLTIVTEVFAELGINNVAYACIAKGVDRNAGCEWFHMPGQTPFQLPPNDPILHYLQRLRDEAHRFAIGSHRNKRSKTLVASELDSVPGIGASRKKALLHHFGSAKAVREASVKDLEHVEGINKKTAAVIYNYFHS